MPTVRRASVYFGDTTPTFPAGRNVFVRYLKAIILYQTSSTLGTNFALPPCFLNRLYKIEVTLTNITFYVF